MKKTITFLAVCLFIVSANAKDYVCPQDTVIRTIEKVIEKDCTTGETITTTTTSEEIKPTISRPESSISYDGSEYSFIFSWKKKKRLDAHWSGIGMGFMNYDNNIPNGSLKMSRSHNFTVNLFEYQRQIAHSNWLLVSGVGLDWSRYHFDDNAGLTKEDGTTFFKPAPNGVDYKSTKMLAYYVTVPLLLEYQYSNFHISAGVVGFFKYYSKSQVKYYTENQKIKQNLGKDLNIRPVDMKLRFQIGFDDIAVYGYYSPFSMFKKDKGPDLNMYMIGVMIGI